MAEQALSPISGYPDANLEARQVIRIGMLIILVMFGGFGSWIVFAPLHGAVLASGQVKVENSRKTVQHLEGGIVGSILVKEGDQVKQGQILLTLDNTQVDAQYNVISDQLLVEQATTARLMAEKAGYSQIRFPNALQARSHEPKVAEILQNETHLFNTRRNTLNNEIALLYGQIEEVKREIVALESQIKATGTTIGYLQEELALNERLAKKGFVAAPRLLEFKRSLSGQEDRQGEYAADIARAQQKIKELGLRIASLKHEYETQASDALKQSQDKMFDLHERLRIPEDELRRQQIVAPVTGRVVGLKVHTVGGVIAAREPLMDIVPEERDLIVESQVSINDIDDLKLNMDAEVRLTAYKQRTTPLVMGKLVYIAADSMVNEATNNPYYLVHVRVDGESIREAGENITLYPGMPADVYILTQSRTAMEYLLDPITTTLRNSFREP